MSEARCLLFGYRKPAVIFQCQTLKMRSQRESGHVFIHGKCARNHRGQEPAQAELEAPIIDNTPAST